MYRYFTYMAFAVVMLIVLGAGCVEKENKTTVLQTVVHYASDTIALAEPVEVEIVEIEKPDLSAKEIIKVQKFVDSLMSLDIALPALFDEKSYDTAITNSLKSLAEKTGGELKIVATADKLQQEIIGTLCKFSVHGADIIFLIDNTGSMEDDIAVVKAGMQQLIDAIQEKKFIRIAIGIYRDKTYNGEKWFQFRNFERDYAAARMFADSMITIGNGDTPESVYEAFFEANKQHFWRSGSKRMTVIIGDAAGKVKANGGDYDAEDMVKLATASSVKVNLFPIIVSPLLERYRPQAADGPVLFTPKKFISRIYPNPVTDYVYIEFDSDSLHHIDLFNAKGEVVDKLNVDGKYWRFNMQEYANGLYIFRVRDKQNQVDQGKFVVRH